MACRRKHGVQVDSMLIDQATFAEAARQLRSSNWSARHN